MKWCEEIMWEAMKTTQNVNIYGMRETIMFITTALVRFSTRVSQLSTWNFFMKFIFSPFVYFFHFLLCFFFLLHQKWKLVHICKLTGFYFKFFLSQARFFHHFSLNSFFSATHILFLLCCTLFCILRVYFYIFSSVIFWYCEE